MKKEIIQTLHDIRDSAQPLSKAALRRERKRFVGGGTMIKFYLGILVGIGIMFIVYAVYKLLEDV